MIRKQKISVVIPAYNEADFIGSCLDSLLNQTERPDEIIVVDNNSTDNTNRISLRKGVKVIAEKRKGIHYAISKGFNNADSDIIARTDADTIVPRDWIESIKYFFRNTGPDTIGMAGTIRYDSSFLFKVENLIDPFFQSINFLTGFVHMYGANMALRKEAWNLIKNNFNYKSFTHDDYALSKLLRNRGEIIFNKNIKVLTSGRRINKTPLKFILGYPLKQIYTYIKY